MTGARKRPALQDRMESMVVNVERMVHGGAALCRTDAGEVALVTGALPGETVRADMRAQKGVLFGVAVELLTVSTDRVAPSTHPGLDYSFMTYQRQLIEKRAVVADALSRARALAGDRSTPRLAPEDVAGVVPAPSEWRYRSSVQPAVAPGGLGYRLPRSDTVTLLGEDPSATAAVQAAWLLATEAGVHRAVGAHELVIRANDAGEALLSIVSAAAARDLLNLAHTLVRGGAVGVMYAPFDARGRFRSGAERLAGARTILQRYGDVVLTVNVTSFAQPNPEAAGGLYRELARWAGEGQRAAELYAGAGAIAFHLAPGFGSVLAIEIDKSAVARGKRDAERLGVANVEFVRQDARDAGIPDATELVVVDPPRAGLSTSVRSAIHVSKAKRLIYVSCDAATWARDVVDLEQRGFALTRFVPFDFYPQTHHVELLSELTRS